MRQLAAVWPTKLAIVLPERTYAMCHIKSIVFGLVLLAALSVVVADSALATAGSRSALPTSQKLRGTVVWPPAVRPALPFALHDQNNRRFTLQSLRGRVSIVTFLDAHCTTECPITGRELALAQRQLGGTHSPLQLMIIDVDPWKDTPSSERAFAHEVGLVGTWHWLSGTQSELARVWATWGEYVRAGKQDVIHTAAAYLVDQRGFVRVADEAPLRPDWLAESVRALLTPKGGRA